jgi:anti-anti-sigma factor
MECFPVLIPSKVTLSEAVNKFAGRGCRYCAHWGEVPGMHTGPFRVGQVNSVPLIEVAGDVDVSNVHTLEAALEQAALIDEQPVLVSLGGSTYFDSRGMHMLLRFNRRLGQRRRRLVVVVPWHHPLRAVLDALGNAAHITVVQTLAEALAASRSQV